MEKFQEIIEEKLHDAKPLSRGMGLFQKTPHRRETPTLHEIPLHSAPEKLEELQQVLETLQTKAEELTTRSESRPWLSQAMDLVTAWVLFLLFPLSIALLTPIPPKLLLTTPLAVVFLGLFYVFLLSGYLWLCHFLEVPTLGMRFQSMTSWPTAWKWPPMKLFPALKRALGHLTLDSLWRKS